MVRPELGGREGVERFLREIELAARLQHPHILPVFDSGVIEDGAGSPVPYFVMPYVEGETLRQGSDFCHECLDRLPSRGMSRLQVELGSLRPNIW